MPKAPYPCLPRYLLFNTRVSFAQDTKLAMSAKEYEQAQADERAKLDKDMMGVEQMPEYHFICEAFFLTAKALKLGLGTGLGELTQTLHQL